MKIIVDAFGGDHAPLEIVKGAVDAAREYGVQIVLTGDRPAIERCAKENGVDISACEIVHAPQIIQMEDDAKIVLKQKRDSSMGKGLDLLAQGEGDAFVSAGSTAALIVGGTFIVKRVKGIRRCAIASVMPSDTAPFLLIDCGANAECEPEFLRQFAQMGSIYMERVLGVQCPRVGLANIGTEETKGTPFVRACFELLKNDPTIRFIGNVEARDVPFGVCDVVVSDGFTGNILLKTYEGVAGMFSKNIKSMLKKNPLSLFGALFIKGGLDAFKKKMDYKQYGGAPLLGLSAPVIKAHGSSDAFAFKNAVRQAKECCEKKIIEEIGAGLAGASGQSSDD